LCATKLVGGLRAVDFAADHASNIEMCGASEHST
jgi:hypothetical protein